MTKKLVTTLDINYEPRITEITVPYMKEYAKNIGADFFIIDKRAYSDHYPVTLEKLQLYKVSEGYDWTVFLDADLLINPNTYDLTTVLDFDTILTPEHLNPFDQFKPRNVLGKYSIPWHCPLFISVFSSETRNAFEWPEVDPLELVDYINPKSPGHTHYENSREELTKPEWFLDELVYNLNIAKYKIATASIKESFPGMSIAAHQAAPVEEKIKFLQKSVEQLKTL